jgi:outer membrane protein OmpA-like peptidoglycan-associated protein
MKRLLRLGLAMALASGAFAAAEEGDVKGSKEHWLFTRMPGFVIGEYSEVPFDSYPFGYAPGSPRIEGRKTVIRYWVKSNADSPTPLQICRNHTAAVTRIGGTVVQDNGSNAVTVKLQKDGKEAWAEVLCDRGRYQLTVVEKEAMAQVVSAAEMLRALDHDGYVALDIRFDTGKSTIKPESRPVLDQIVALLKANAGLRIAIEGHTDDVGSPASNRTLSEARARSVRDAVIGQGVDQARLTAAGFGQDRPVADNRTEEGRAKNRRVELVKR